MAGKRTFFSSGAIDIRDLWVGAGGACSSLEMTCNWLSRAKDTLRTTVPSYTVSGDASLCKAKHGCPQTHSELLFWLLRKKPSQTSWLLATVSCKLFFFLYIYILKKAELLQQPFHSNDNFAKGKKGDSRCICFWQVDFGLEEVKTWGKVKL